MELVIDLKEKSYPIIIEKGIINRVGEEVSKVYKGKRIFIITDHNVSKYYGDKVLFSLKNKNFEVKLLSLEPGEKTKGFNTLPDIYNEFLNFNLTRSDLIIALGGGVIGDLAGFAASTYLRGIDFIVLTLWVISSPTVPSPRVTPLTKIPLSYIKLIARPSILSSHT